MALRIIALLGRRDTPTDGVEDYCKFLSEALSRRGVEMNTARVDWADSGWVVALRKLRRQATAWRGSWIVIHYTALSWSRRGFPFGVLLVLWALRRQGLHCAVVFHEPFRHGGERRIDQARSRCQDWVIRRLYARARQAIFLDPLEKLTWLPRCAKKASFIPIGANIPEVSRMDVSLPSDSGAVQTIAVFCLSNRFYRGRELEDIGHAVRFACLQGLKLRVVFLGRGTAEAKEEIDELFHSTTVDVVNLGLQPTEEVQRFLATANVMLCVRGPIFMRRGSAIAGIACGLPIVGYAGDAEGTPLAEAGVELVPYRDKDALARALASILMDPERQRVLGSKSRETQRKYFSWDRIADLHVRIFTPADAPLKLLIYSHAWAPVIGGIQTYVMSLARGFAARRPEQIDATVVTRTPRGGMNDGALPFRVVRRPDVRQLFHLVKGADVLHLAGAAFLPLLFALVLRKPVVVEHDGYQAICPNGLLIYGEEKSVCPGFFMRKKYHKCIQCQCPDQGFLRSVRATALTLIRRSVTKRATANVFPSRHVAARALLPKSELIYHGATLKHPQLAAFSAEQNPVCFAFAGRLVPEKGADILLRAAHDLLKTGYDFRVRIVGDGIERRHLERLSAELGLGGLIEFTGSVPIDEVDSMLSPAQVVVIPSTWEDVAPLVVPEQMMQGRLLISSDIGGLGETVGEYGLRFPPGDAASLARCMRYVIENPEAANQLCDRARRHALDVHSESRMVEAHAALYRSISRAPRKSGSISFQDAQG